MLRIRYKTKQSVFEYDVPRNAAAEMLAVHMANWRRETVTIDGKEVTREVPASDVVAEWVDGDAVEFLPVPEYTGPAPKR